MFTSAFMSSRYDLDSIEIVNILKMFGSKTNLDPLQFLKIIY